MRNGTSSQAELTGDSLATSKASSDVFDDFKSHNSGLRVSTHVALVTSLRRRYPDWTVTITNAYSTDLIAFAQAGQATAELDTRDESLVSRVHHIKRDRVSEEPGITSDDVHFGKYDYQWNSHKFIVYTSDLQGDGSYKNYYILHKRGHELVDGRCPLSDDLIAAAARWNTSVHDEILVFDQERWSKNSELWASVQNSSWDDVIMDKDLKETLVSDVQGFFDCREDYKEFGVPWKRGVILHGLPGNGKTISIKALMYALYKRPEPIPTLYVKSLAGSFGSEFAVREIFVKARQSAPCLLVFEDLDSLITDNVKSVFLNEVDGLESNEGLMMLGTTNHLERLDAGMSKRPGRFDRKYHFSLPATSERIKYCNHWRNKLAANKNIDFPPKLSEAIAEITEGFSFAYLKETFVMSLLAIAGSRRGSKAVEALPEAGADTHELDYLLLWRVMNKQVKMLRAEMEDARKSAEEAAKNNDAADITIKEGLWKGTVPSHSAHRARRGGYGGLSGRRQML